MRKEKIIGGIMAGGFVIALAIVGFFVWQVQHQSPKKVVTKAIQTEESTIPTNTSLSVGNNLGLGAGLESGGNSAQAGEAIDSKPKQSGGGGPNTAEFAQYDKYKDEKTALFGELKVGTGAEAVPNKKLSIYYKVWLTNGQLIDQTTTQAFPFVLGEHKVIPGLEQAIQGMKAGGTRLLIVPPASGYGSQDKEGIPPNSVLVFEVQLISVE